MDSENEDAVVVAVETQAPKKKKKSKKSKVKERDGNDNEICQETYEAYVRAVTMESGDRDRRKSSTSSGEAVVLESYTHGKEENQNEKRKEKQKKVKKSKERGKDDHALEERLKDGHSKQKGGEREKSGKSRKDADEKRSDETERSSRESKEERKRERKQKSIHKAREKDEEKDYGQGGREMAGKIADTGDETERQQQESSRRRHRKSPTIGRREKWEDSGDGKDDGDDVERGEKTRKRKSKKRGSKKDRDVDSSEPNTEKTSSSRKTKFMQGQEYQEYNEEYSSSVLTEDRKAADGFGETYTVQRGILKSNSSYDGFEAESAEPSKPMTENRWWESAADERNVNRTDGYSVENRNEVKFSVVEDASKLNERRRSKMADDYDSESTVSAWSTTEANAGNESKSEKVEIVQQKDRPGSKSKSESNSESGSSSYSSGSDSGSDSDTASSGSYSDSRSGSEYTEDSESYSSGSSYSESFTDGSYSGSESYSSGSDFSGSESDYDSDYSTDDKYRRREFDDKRKERIRKEADDDTETKCASPREERPHSNEEDNNQRGKIKQEESGEIFRKQNDLNKTEEGNTPDGAVEHVSNTANNNKATSRTCSIM